MMNQQPLILDAIINGCNAVIDDVSRFGWQSDSIWPVGNHARIYIYIYLK